MVKTEIRSAIVSGYVGQYCRGCKNREKRPTGNGGFFYGCSIQPNHTVLAKLRKPEGCDLAVVHGNPGTITKEGFTPRVDA